MASKVDLNETAMIFDHQSRLSAIENTLKKIEGVSEDMATAKTKLEYIADGIDEFKKNYADLDKRLREEENTVAKYGERIGIMAVIQTAITLLVSSVISYYKKG